MFYVNYDKERQKITEITKKKKDDLIPIKNSDDIFESINQGYEKLRNFIIVENENNEYELQKKQIKKSKNEHIIKPIKIKEVLKDKPILKENISFYRYDDYILVIKNVDKSIKVPLWITPEHNFNILIYEECLDFKKDEREKTLDLNREYSVWIRT